MDEDTYNGPERGQLSRLQMPNTVISYTRDLFGMDNGVALVCINDTVYMPRPRRLPLAALPQTTNATGHRAL